MRWQPTLLLVTLILVPTGQCVQAQTAERQVVLKAREAALSSGRKDHLAANERQLVAVCSLL